MASRSFYSNKLLIYIKDKEMNLIHPYYVYVIIFGLLKNQLYENCQIPFYYGKRKRKTEILNEKYIGTPTVAKKYFERMKNFPITKIILSTHKFEKEAIHKEYFYINKSKNNPFSLNENVNWKFLRID